MPTTTTIQVSDLSLDLKNFRTIEQPDEISAINAMISISPDYFWGLLESLLNDGYLPTENIIVLRLTDGTCVVKEGNRRIASLKIILGQINGVSVGLPDALSQRIASVTAAYIASITSVPCLVYDQQDEAIVDRIVTLAHGKGQKASREAWESVARARHNKLKNGSTELALDLLEKYIQHGRNITASQKLRWSGKYNLSVLDEAIRKVASRFGVANTVDLVNQYPGISHRQALEEIIHAIGMETLTFPAIRGAVDFALRFGLPASLPIPPIAPPPPGPGPAQVPPPATNPGPGPVPVPPSASPTLPPGPIAAPINDQATVRRQLRSLQLYGNHRAKLASVRAELLKINIRKTPIAFCFMLRSTFELSAKAYCQDHSASPGCPSIVDGNGRDRNLADLLRDIVDHLTQNGQDRAMVRTLHGPLTEITQPNRLLSVTSMNQLVHNQSFSLIPSDIPILFSNIFPLLDEMNK